MPVFSPTWLDLLFTFSVLHERHETAKELGNLGHGLQKVYLVVKFISNKKLFFHTMWPWISPVKILPYFFKISMEKIGHSVRKRNSSLNIILMHWVRYLITSLETYLTCMQCSLGVLILSLRLALQQQISDFLLCSGPCMTERTQRQLWVLLLATFLT